jgi:membrane protease YdiL (CAAX protease family)
VPFLGIAFAVLTIASGTLVLRGLGLVDAKANPVGLAGFVAFLVLPFSALALVVVGWVRLVERRPLAAIGLGGAHRWRTFLGGLLTGAAMATVIILGMWGAGGLRFVAIGYSLQTLASLASIATLLVCFALQSAIEELLFRGWMLSAIAVKFGIGWAVLLSSLTFTVMHFDENATWMLGVNAFLFAVFASFWAIRTGNIWGVMGWHGGWNWILAVGFELRVTALDAHQPALLARFTPIASDYRSGGVMGPEGSILCTGVLLCGIAYQLQRARRGAMPVDSSPSSPDNKAL